MSTSIHSNTSRSKNTEENDDEDDESVAYICTECWNQLDRDNREMWDRCELSDAQSSPRGAHLQLVARKDELEEHLLPMIQWNRTSAKQWHASISRPKPNDSTQQGPTRYNKDGNSDNSMGKDGRSTRRLAAYDSHVSASNLHHFTSTKRRADRLLSNCRFSYPALGSWRSPFWTQDLIESYIPGDKEKFFRENYRRGHIFVATGYKRSVLWDACTTQNTEMVDEEEASRIATMQLVACACYIVQLPERERKLMSKTFSAGTKVEILNLEILNDSTGGTAVDTNSEGRETSGHWVITETFPERKQSKVQNLLDGRTKKVSNADLRMYYPEFCCEGSMERECVKWMDRIFSERRAAQARWGSLPIAVQTVSLRGNSETAWFETHMRPNQSAVFSTPFLKNKATPLSQKRHKDERYSGYEYLVSSKSEYASRSNDTEKKKDTNGLVQLYAFVLLQPAIVYIKFCRSYKKERGGYWPSLDPHVKTWWLEASSETPRHDAEPSSFFLKNKSSLDTVAEDEEFKQEEEFAEYPTYFSSYQRGDTVVIFGDPSCGMVLGHGFHVYLKRQHTNAALPSRVFMLTHNQMLGAYYALRRDISHDPLSLHVLTSLERLHLICATNALKSSSFNEENEEEKEDEHDSDDTDHAIPGLSMLPFWLEAFVNPPLEIMTDRERYIRRVVMNEFEERIMETWNRAKRKGLVADESLVITALTLLGPLFKDCTWC